MSSVRSITSISTPLLKDSVCKLPFEEWLPRRKSHLGRPDYQPIGLFKAYLLKVRENFQYDTTLEEKLYDNETFRAFCGFTPQNIPAHDTFSSFFRKLTPSRLNTIFLQLDRELTALGVFDHDELALDATDILSNSRNRHNLDPEAGWGHKSDGELFHGYWAVFAAGTVSEMPRAVRVGAADSHQSLVAQDIFRQLRSQDLRGATLLVADSAYDDKKTYHSCIELELVPLISYNPRRSHSSTFETLKPSNWRKRSLGAERIRLRRQYYHLRQSVEHYQSTFKEILKGRAVPVRGLTKVTSYLLVGTILSQLYALINWEGRSGQKSHYHFPLDHFFS
jgi:transposase